MSSSSLYNKWHKGQQVICTWTDPKIGTTTEHLVKILDFDLNNNVPSYLIHYQGWKDVWDEWITIWEAETRFRALDDKPPNYFTVEKLVAKREIKRRNGAGKITRRIEYLVRWKGYPPDEDTWESRDHLIKDVSWAVDYFEKSTTSGGSNKARLKNVLKRQKSKAKVKRESKTALKNK